MRIKHHMLLLCLVFIALYNTAGASKNSFINVIVNQHSPHQEPKLAYSSYESNSDPDLYPRLLKATALSGYAHPYATSTPGSPKTICKVKAPTCTPLGVCAPPIKKPCILPGRECGQWELAVQAFFARVRGRVSWPYHPTIDFNDDLGLDSHKTLFEYSARYQFRPRWAIIYSIMPIEMEANYINPRFPGMTFKSKWENIYQRVGLLFEPIKSCSGSIAIYNAWVFNEQKLTTHTGSHCVASRTTKIDRTRNMVMSGIEIQRCITTKCNGGSLSCDTRVGIAYLDGTFGLDVQTGLRYSIPMNCGRWGYARGGYRLLDFKEDRVDYRIDTYLDGWFVELGLVF